MKEELKEWDQCLSMLGEAKVDDDGNVYDMKDSNVMYLDKDCEDREINVSSLLYIYIYIWMQLNLCLVIYYSWTLQGKPGSSLAKDKDILLKFQVCKGACLFVNSMKTFK